MENNNFLTEYGLEYEVIEASSAELEEQGYKKLPVEAYEKVAMLFQYAPSQFAEQAARKAGNQLVNDVSKDAYKVILKDGMHLASSKATEGANRGTLLSNSTNQVAGQADWLKIPEGQQISAASQYALGVFNIMSAVTGQYFLSEINSKIESIETAIDSIAEYLEDEKESEIWAEQQVLWNTYVNMEYIKANDGEKNATLMELKSIKRNSLKNMKAYEKKILRQQEKLLAKDNSKAIISNLETMLKYMPQYLCTVSIYANATWLEVVLADIDNPTYLNNIKSDIETQLDGYKASYGICLERINDALDNSKALNYEDTRVAKVLKFAADLPAVNNVPVVVGKLAAYGVNEFNKSKSNKDKDKVERISGCIEASGNYFAVEESLANIDEYYNLRNKPLEIVQTENEVFLKVVE